jgi:MFS family permease
MAKHYKWAVVGMLWLVCFFNYADRQVIFSIFPVLRTEYGFDPVQLGLIGSAFMWLYAGGAPFAGYLSDRLKRKHLILGGSLFWSGMTALTGSCARLGQFLTVRALTGLGETFYFPAAMSLLSDYHGRRTRSKALAVHQSSVYFGTIAGGWAGAWFAERHGWRAGFYGFGLAGVGVSLLLYRFLREPARGAAEPAAAAETPPVLPPPGLGETARLVLSRPTAWLLMGAFLCANFVATIFLAWTPTFLVDKFGFSLAGAGLSGSAFIHLASAASVPLGGVMADRLARRWAGGRILVQAAGVLAGASFVALVGLTHHRGTLLTGMVLFGFCKGLYDSNIFASLYDVIEPRARGAAAGLMNTVGWGGGALGPLAVGLATKYGRHPGDAVANMSDAIAAGALVYLVAGALLLTAALGFARRDGAAVSR